jgi:hypothetical protein
MSNQTFSPDQIARCVPRLDSAETATISRDLLYVMPRMYEVQFAPNRARLVIPTVTDVSSGASAFAYQWSEGVGAANISRDGDPAPMVNERADEEIVALHTIRDGFRYNLQEMRGDEFSRRGRLLRLARHARQAIETKLSAIGFSGDTQYRLGGLFNATGVANASAVNGTWGSASADQILEDVSDVISDVATASDGVFEANRVVMALSAYRYLASTPRANSDTTLLAWLQSNNPGVQFMWCNEAETAGTGSTRLMLAFAANPDNVGLVIAQDFEALPPVDFADHLDFKCRLRTGGTVWFQPLAGAQAYGI